MYLAESFLEPERFRKQWKVQKCLRALETVIGICMSVNDCNQRVNISKKDKTNIYLDRYLVFINESRLQLRKIDFVIFHLTFPLIVFFFIKPVSYK